MQHGIVNFYKPKGITSNRALTIFKKTFFSSKKLKFGYVGTLDPFAEGVLPILIGEATKLSDYCLNQTKHYEFVVHWGVSTDSFDTQGNVTLEKNIIPNIDDVKKACKKMLGKIKQTPPIYSAIKINGKRACDRARAGESNITLEPREVEIYNLDVFEGSSIEYTKFLLRCSKGTYVLSIVRDMSELLDVPCHAISLIRQQTGNFNIKNSINLDYIKKFGLKNSCNSYIEISSGELIAKACNLSIIRLNDCLMSKLMYGQKVTFQDLECQQLLSKEKTYIDNELLLVVDQNEFAKGIVNVCYDGDNNKFLKIKRMFCF